MVSVSNLKIDFKKVSSKQNLKKNELNVLFLNNFKEIKFKPIWLNNEIEMVHHFLDDALSLGNVRVR